MPPPRMGVMVLTRRMVAGGEMTVLLGGEAWRILGSVRKRVPSSLVANAVHDGIVREELSSRLCVGDVLMLAAKRKPHSSHTERHMLSQAVKFGECEPRESFVQGASKDEGSEHALERDTMAGFTGRTLSFGAGDEMPFEFDDVGKRFSSGVASGVGVIFNRALCGRGIVAQGVLELGQRGRHIADQIAKLERRGVTRRCEVYRHSVDAV